MGKRRGKRRGHRSVQEASAGGSEYLKLSLEGKWVRLAKAWLANNMPCTAEDYFVQVIPLMPTHIIRRRLAVRSTQEKLARDALTVLKVDASSGFINHVFKKPDRSRWHNMVGKSHEVNIHEFDLTKKEADCLRKWLTSNGYKSMGKSVYQKPKPELQEPKDLQE
jgi:hypothetical protein